MEKYCGGVILQTVCNMLMIASNTIYVTYAHEHNNFKTFNSTKLVLSCINSVSLDVHRNTLLIW